MSSARQPALFLDRDGVINEEKAYLFRRDDVRFMPGIFELMRTAAQLGYRLIVITNQAGIARGYPPQPEVGKVNIDHGERELAKCCKRISLVDLQPANIEATRLALGRVRSAMADFHCQPAKKLSLASACYDGVFLIEVLDHVRDVAAHPVKFAGLLVTPYLFPLLPWLPFLHRRMATARVFTRCEIDTLAAQAGFRSARIGYVMPPFERTGLASMRRLAQLCGRSSLRVFGVSIAAVLTK